MKFICPLLVVKNMAKSRDFYESVLEQKIKFDFGENVTFEGDFAIHWQEHYSNLLNKSINLSKSHSFELYFETEQMEKTIEKLKRNNVEFLHDLREQPWGQLVVRFYDPDNHIIEIGETLESLARRLTASGMTCEQISDKTSLPLEYVRTLLKQS